MTRELIEGKGLNPWELIDSRHGANPLHFACTSGNIELVKYLIIESHCYHLRISDDDLTTLYRAVTLCQACRGWSAPVWSVRYLMGLLGSRILYNQCISKVMLIASYNGSSNDLAKYLIVEKRFSPSLNDSTNGTMLYTPAKISRFKL